MAKTPAWFVCWQCGCSDAQTDPANLPQPRDPWCRCGFAGCSDAGRAER